MERVVDEQGLAHEKGHAHLFGHDRGGHHVRKRLASVGSGGGGSWHLSWVLEFGSPFTWPEVNSCAMWYY